MYRNETGGKKMKILLEATEAHEKNGTRNRLCGF